MLLCAWCIWMFLLSPYLHLRSLSMLAWQAAAMIMVRVPGFLYDLYVFFSDFQFFPDPNFPLFEVTILGNTGSLAVLTLAKRVNQPPKPTLKRPSTSNSFRLLLEPRLCRILVPKTWIPLDLWNWLRILFFLKKESFFHGCHVLCVFVEFYSNPDTQCTLYLPYIYHNKLTTCRHIYHTLSVWVKVMFVSSWILLGLKK